MKHPFVPGSKFEVISEGCFLTGIQAGACMTDWRRELVIGDVLVCLGCRVKSQGWGETMIHWEVKDQRINPFDCAFNPSVIVKGLNFTLPDISKLREIVR